MRNYAFRICAVAATVMLFKFSSAQTVTKTELLKQASIQQAATEKADREKLLVLAKQKGWDLIVTTKNKKIVAVLIGVDGFGLPLYHITDNNIVAAATIGTNKLWPGGSTGLNLSGSSNNMKDKLGLWEAGNGRPLSTHVELTGRILQKDNPSTVTDHATHVAGILMASGVNPVAKGMSFGLQELWAYDSNNDRSEMMNAAAENLLVSNHSYGFSAGWNFNDAQNRWEFLGTFDANEDYKFGYYSIDAQVWDSIAYNAPYYLIAKSAGNNRSVNGPAVGQPYWRYNSSGVMANAGNRPAGISSNDSYEILSTTSNAKNILVVGAINPISSGYSRPADVVMSDFSSWGPTDDGRIKPDVVADGVNLLSSVNTSNNAYAVFSGTSMATPNASGSLFLLQEYYSQLHSGAFMRSATLKGLAIHTADEAGGSPGPDYQFGWGLVNMQKAAAVITANNTTHLIQENVLNNGGTLSIPVIASGNGTISATLSWTDPKGQVTPVASALNDHTKKLVNDLDLVIKKGATTYRSWTLDPNIPSLPATRGDNTLDNVEKVEIPDIVPGDTYTIEVTHKGTLERGTQAYSLIVSGVGGAAYCTSNPTSNTGARIDSVSFSNIQQKNPTSCDTYNNFTNLIGNLQPSQTLPFFVRLRSCDATSVIKMLKIYIDANNDGDFADPGETLATSGNLNGDIDYNGNITVPASLTPGKYTMLRIVMSETSDATTITPCGTYTKGETQDYRIFISDPSIDVGITELISPLVGECQTGEQYASVRIKNFGSSPATNVPVSVVVKQGATTIATLNGSFNNSIPGGADVEYTFQTPFAMNANTAYSFTATTSLAGDQLAANNQLAANITTGAAASSPTGTATICGTTATLTANSSALSPFNWYTSSSTTSVLTTGSPATTNTIQATYYLSSGEVNKTLGPPNKTVFPDGGYNQFGPGVRFTTTLPTTLKSVRLYIGNSGKIVFHLRQVVSFNETDGSYTYFPIADKTLNVVATKPTPPVLGAQDNDPSDLGAIYNLGIDIPEANNYILAIEYLDGASIFRNNLITGTNYPYSIPGLISMTGNTVTTPTPNWQTYYYYLYNLAVKPSIGCPSPRVAITATTSPTPTISVAGNVLTSSASVSYQWFLENNPISGATNQSYTAVSSGNYTVQTTDATGCTLTSAPTNFSVTAVPNIDPSEIGLTVSPNPSRGQFTIRLETRTKANLDIALMNTSGQRVYHSAIPDFIGKLTKTVEQRNLASGVYYLQIIHDKKMYIQKVTIAQ